MGKNGSILIAVIIASVVLGIGLTQKFGLMVGLTTSTAGSVLGLIAATLLDIRELLYEATKKS